MKSLEEIIEILVDWADETDGAYVISLGTPGGELAEAKGNIHFYGNDEIQLACFDAMFSPWTQECRKKLQKKVVPAGKHKSDITIRA